MLKEVDSISSIPSLILKAREGRQRERIVSYSTFYSLQALSGLDVARPIHVR